MTNESAIPHTGHTTLRLLSGSAGGSEGAPSPSWRGASPPAASGDLVTLLLLEDAARDLAKQAEAIKTQPAWIRWLSAHRKTVAALLRVLEACPAKRRLLEATRRASRRFRYEDGDV